MKPRELAELDATVERETTNPNPSRASIGLAGDARRTAEKAEQATSDKQHRLRQRGTYSVGSVADQRGRMVEVIRHESYLIAKTGSILSAGVLFAISADRAIKLADLLERRTPGRVAGEGRLLQVQKTGNGALQIRDANLAGHPAVLCQLGAVEADRLAAMLRAEA